MPKSENSSINIFSVKYEDIPSVRNSPNFKNTVNIVNKMPPNVIVFLTKSDVSIVIVQNKRTRAVATSARVGPITIRLKPIASLIVLNSTPH